MFFDKHIIQLELNNRNVCESAQIFGNKNKTLVINVLNNARAKGK